MNKYINCCNNFYEQLCDLILCCKCSLGAAYLEGSEGNLSSKKDLKFTNPMDLDFNGFNVLKIKIDLSA